MICNSRFLTLLPYLTDDESLTLRAGRFGMSFGSGRLVATRAAPNIPFRFDGFEAIYSRPLWEATAFLTRPAEDNREHSAAAIPARHFGGFISRTGSTRRTSWELTYIISGFTTTQATYASGTADEDRHSLGLRIFGERNQWDWNEEDVIQVGSFGNNSILAWTASIDSGYTFDAMWQPRLGLKADVTSGSGSTSGGRQETFDALYFKSGYFNDASLLRPQNIIDVHPNAGLKFTRTLSADGGADVFWRYSKNDAVYGVPGNIAIPASGNASSYVGTALDVNLTWQIQRHVSFQASYVHFFTGSYIHQAGGSDVNYVSATLDFLF